MQAFARAASRDVQVHLVGGTTAVLLGWRNSTIDVDFREEYRNGAGEGSDWRTVVDDFVENGECTRGWEIWVDGLQVCDGS